MQAYLIETALIIKTTPNLHRFFAFIRKNTGMDGSLPHRYSQQAPATFRPAPRPLCRNGRDCIYRFGYRCGNAMSPNPKDCHGVAYSYIDLLFAQPSPAAPASSGPRQK